MSKKNSELIKSPGDAIKAPKLQTVLSIPTPRLFNQLIIFILDGSGSMTQPGASMSSKGEEVDMAMHQLFDRLGKSKHSNCFDINAIAFSSEVNEFLPLTPLSNLEKDGWSFDPTAHINNYRTYAFEALKLACATAQAYLEKNKGKNRRALIILLTDGLLDDHEEVLDFLEEVDDEDIFMSTLYFRTLWNDAQKEAWDTDKLDEKASEILSRIASQDELCWQEMDAEAVRDAMIKSISTVSQTKF